MIVEQRAGWIRMLETKGIGTPLLCKHLQKDFHERGIWRKIFVFSIQTLYSAMDRNDKQANKIRI